MTSDALFALTGDSVPPFTDEKLWVVTIHAEVEDMRTSKIASVYSEVIHADTGCWAQIAVQRALLR